MWLVVVVFFLVAACIAEGLVRDRIATWLIRLYLGWWALCLLASSLDPLDLYPVSDFTYSLLLLHVAMFAAGFIAVDRLQEPVVVPDGYRSLARVFHEQVEKSRTVLLVLGAFSLYLLWYYLRYKDALAAAGPGEARTLRYSLGAVFGNPLEYLVFSGIAEALSVALVIALAYSLVLGSIRTWVFLWALVDIYLFASIGAGRTVIVQAGMFIVVLAVLRDTLQPIMPEETRSEEEGHAVPVGRRKRLFLFLVAPALVMAVFMFYLTYSRFVSLDAGLDVLADGQVLTLVSQAFLEQIGIYVLGPFRALDYAVNQPFMFQLQFGRLTFAAIDEVIGLPMRILGFDYPIMNRELGAIIQDDQIFIGTSEFNALYTAVLRFYYDFGVPGVLGFSFLLGAVVRSSVQWFQTSPTPATLSVMLFLFGVAILSTQTWHLSTLAALVLLVGAYLAQRAARRTPSGVVSPARAPG